MRVSTRISKTHKRQIYEYLMKEGTIVVRKDTLAPKHEELDIPNIHVMLVMRSLTSKNYVNETYNWRFYYYVLNNEGIEFLRNFLQVPATVAPETLTQRNRGPRPASGGMRREGGRFDGNRFDGNRERFDGNRERSDGNRERYEGNRERFDNSRAPAVAATE